MYWTLLEDVVEFHPDLEPFVAEAYIQPQESMIPGIEPKTESGVAFQMA
jgi:hypothetical protein